MRVVDVTMAAGDISVANEWATGDLVPTDDGYDLPVTPLCLRTDTVRVAIRGDREQHREVVRRMAAAVGLTVAEIKQ